MDESKVLQLLGELVASVRRIEIRQERIEERQEEILRSRRKHKDAARGKALARSRKVRGRQREVCRAYILAHDAGSLKERVLDCWREHQVEWNAWAEQKISGSHSGQGEKSTIGYPSYEHLYSYFAGIGFAGRYEAPKLKRYAGA